MVTRKPVPKKEKQSDNFTLYVVGGALAVVLVGFVVAWFYFQQSRQMEPTVAYSTFGPMVVRASEFSVRATVTVQTDNDHASWMDANKKQLDYALQTALGQIDPDKARKPDGITYLQTTLQQATNGALKTNNVQQILLTDFIIQTN
jgi:flagellar basal body-associated protein FliL